MTSFISVEQVSKSFQNKKILNDVSFSIEKGSITGLLGPNGAGKTTIIRLLNGVISPEGGKLSVGGFNPYEEGESIRKISGVVTESAALYHELSAYDNLHFYARIYGVEDLSRIDYLLEQFDMTKFKDQKVGTFSTGMKKRISLARALLHRPEILFLDEPTNGLDPEGIQMVNQYLVKMNQLENITVLICSHVLHQLEPICDHFLFIDKGKIIESGNKRTLEEKYLKEIEVKIETDLPHLNDKAFSSYTYRQISDHEFLFTLSDKQEIPTLLQNILSYNSVYSCEITNRNLESLYFKIRGEHHE